jgi:ABC-type glycerol-3-phosphate transport system substrate-binding protein
MSAKGVRVRKHRMIAIAMTMALALAACGGSDDGGGTGATGATASTGDRPSSTAKLSIVAPKVGQVVHGSNVDLRVKLQDAKLVPATTTHIVPDEGHLHVILDDTLISMTEGLEQTIPDVAPGEHRIMVEFVASDHAPFDPRVVSVVAFEVQP